MPIRICAFLAAVLVVDSSAIAEKPPTAADLLVKYQFTVRRLSRVHIETHAKVSDTQDNITATKDIAIHRDENRWKITHIQHGRRKFRGSWLKFDSGHEYLLGEEGMHCQWQIAADGKTREKESVLAYLDPAEAEEWLWHGYMKMGVILFGQTGGDLRQPTWQVMREAPTLELLPATELVDGFETHVLKSKGKYGAHTVWLDPDMGCLPRRVEVLKRTGDYLNEGKLGSQNTNKPVKDMSPDPSTVPDPEVLEIRMRFEKFKLEIREGRHVIMAFDFERKVVFEDSHESISREELQVQSIEFGDAGWPADSFRPTIEMPEGRVVYARLARDAPYDRTGYEWRKGKIRKKQ